MVCPLSQKEHFAVELKLIINNLCFHLTPFSFLHIVTCSKIGYLCIVKTNTHGYYYKLITLYQTNNETQGY